MATASLVCVPVSARASAQSAPHGHDLHGVRDECRAFVRKQAMLSAAASFLPIPGVDVITDVAVLSRLVTQINARFDVTADDLAKVRNGWGRLDRTVAYRLATAASGLIAYVALTRTANRHIDDCMVVAAGRAG